MLDLHYWPTPNGWKITIMLEECGIPYRIVPVNLARGDQFTPEFLAMNPNNKMPVIVDHDAAGGPLTIFESGAILLYLAEKAGRLLPRDQRARFEVIEWLFWQVGGLGPMAGQANYFLHYADEKIPAAIERFTEEVTRLFKVMDRRLAEGPYLGGAYSIADVATYPWAVGHERIDLKITDFPNVGRWLENISARPAVQKGMSVGKDLRAPSKEKDE
jgi:GST-like protein